MPTARLLCSKTSAWHRAALCLALALAAAVASAALEVDKRDYDRLLESRYAGPLLAPPGGFGWSMDTASWDLTSGKVWLMEPTSSGAVTGLVFEGEGSFSMKVPDGLELRQLRRFAENEELDDELAFDYDTLVVRTNQGETLLGLGLFDTAAASYDKLGLAAGRHERWRIDQFLDADARVVTALRNPGDIYLRVEMKTDEHGWVAFEYDELRPEEIEVTVMKQGIRRAG